METRWEQALRTAHAYGFQGEEARQAAKHIFAKMVVNGATIGRANGKMIVHKGGSRYAQETVLS